MRAGLITSTIVAGLFCLQPLAAQATVQVSIDLTHQRMHVQSNEGSYDWAVSTAASGFSTPGGSFAPTHLELMHYSHKYHMSPMPHAIFFRGGYAIHGTYSTASLGRPASHGCVRLAPGNATVLYNLVKSEGARISISGTPPASPRLYEARRTTRPASDGYGDVQPRSAGYSYGAQPYGYGQPYAYGQDYGATAYGVPTLSQIFGQ